MTIHAIESISAELTRASELRKSTTVDFGQVFASELKQADALIKNAESASQLYAVGETDNIHQVMIAISKAQTNFDLMVQVRNRMVEGVQDLMKMSI